MRAVVFAACLAVAGALITVGMWGVRESAGYVTAGLVVGGWSWLVLSE